METSYHQERPVKKESNKIYLLVAIILTLLGTNTYLFLKDKKNGEQVTRIGEEKLRLQTEIDKIELELDKANSKNIKLSIDLEREKETAEQRINELRTQLQKGSLTRAQILKTQEDIKQLRYFVSKYTADIEQLEKQNAILTAERDSLQTTVTDVNRNASKLKSENEQLASKIRSAAALKANSILITPIRVKDNGKESNAKKAKDTKKMRFNFSIMENDLAEKGIHTVYIRIIDVSGNLIISDSNDLFVADEEDLQYTYKTAIEFTNSGESYVLDWTNPEPFQKGTYTILFYSDGHLMGQSSVDLK